ncbi:unnamed protein product [Paramecium sonneborni]|uniref:Transmembrane protein n=1 Tax=Paramecium sonneborni TaxID=65129 RepID=A0A8S1QU32_9CILI|nr:unnamed protein product [Paramecium sonneborni]
MNNIKNSQQLEKKQMIILLTSVINIYAQNISVLEYSLYPTEGEFYQYDLFYVLSYTQLICKMDHQVPNVQLINSCEEIFRTKGDQFISVSSNNTHFCTLSNQNIVTLYEWKNQKIQQFGSTVTINTLFKCFNIILSQHFSILVDCYLNDELFLIQLQDEQQQIVFSMQSSLPTSTKIQSIMMGTNAFLVYAQYFENYSILSLFTQQFLNSSSLQDQFIDFDIPLTISPNIYVITGEMIFQLTITQDQKFYQKSNFTQKGMSNFIMINAYYNYWSYAQCDQIVLLYFQYTSNLSDQMMAQLLGCEGQIIKIDDRLPFNQRQSVKKIIQNNQFLIYITNNESVIKSKSQSEGLIYSFYQINQSNSLLYLNDDNELFQFNQEIFIYKISLPSIQINLTKKEISNKRYYNFTFLCSHSTIFTLFKIQMKILLMNDTNVYVMSNSKFQDSEFYQNATFKQQIAEFSGQLLNYKLSKNETYFNFIQVTFFNAGRINQTYQLVQFLAIKYAKVEEQYLIGYNNCQIDILTCSNQSYILCTQQNSINISVNASSLQASFSIYPTIVTIGLNAYDKIYLFQYYQDNQSLISYSNYTCENEISEFVLTYNSLIILFKKKKEIKVMKFNFRNIFTLKQQSINQFFNKIQFNPIQIVVNTQLQSSLLYINNINEVIIISIDQNNFPIPISLVQINFIIKQINLINQQLILSYLCNKDQNICFQVWNVQNLPIYYYVKSLYRENVEKEVKIQSDNLFLYVTFRNYTVYVYNPSLPYHMSLYYKFELTSPIQFSFQQDLLEKHSIIISNNNFYILHGDSQLILMYEYQNQDFNNTISYPQFTYNYTVTSALNISAFQYTPNQTVTFYSNFTIFQNERNLSKNLSNNNLIPKSKNLSYPMNLILDRQVAYCGSTNPNQTQNLNQYCSLTQFSPQSSSIYIIQNYSLITAINNQFFALQNNSFIQTVNSDLTNKFNFNYSYLNLSECLHSTSYIYSLYTICQNNQSQYLLNFQLNFEGDIVNLNITQLPQTFYYIYKIRSILNQIFILGSLEFQQQQLYWLNQFNNTLQSISNLINDFSIGQIQQSEFSKSQQIIIFYITYSVSYTIMTIDEQGVNLLNPVYVNIVFCYQDLSCYYYSSQLNYVLILEIYSNYAIIFVSNIYQGYVVQLKFSLQNTKSSNGIFVGSIPNYSNLNNTGYSFYQNEVLMQQFTQGNQNQFIVGVYYFNNIKDENLSEPTLMQGSFNTTMYAYAMIVESKYQKGTALYIYNNNLSNYSISTWNVTCHLRGNQNKEVNVSIFCSNLFSNGTYNIIFKPPQQEKSSRRWIYALISLITLLLLYFYIKVKQKTKNEQFNTFQIEL